MKVFIVSQSLNDRPTEELIKLLSIIVVDPSLSTSVVAIDELYSLSAIADRYPHGASEQVLSERFTLDDFCTNRHCPIQERLIIDSNLLATQLSRTRKDWVVIDLEYNSLAVTLDLIKKLAHYVFMCGHLMSRNLVLLVPSIYVGVHARTANEKLNNLPITSLETERSGQMQVFFLSVGVGRAALRLPSLGKLVRRVQIFFIYFYKRLGRIA